MDAGLLSAEITLNNKKINFGLKKLSPTKYEIQLLPKCAGTYKVRLLLNGLTVKGSPFAIKMASGPALEKHLQQLQPQQKSNPVDLDQSLDKSEKSQKSQSQSESGQKSSHLCLTSVTSIPSILRTELVSCTDRSSLVVGREFKLNVALLGRTSPVRRLGGDGGYHLIYV